jgi:undecaprenyl-diphosphatase
MKNKAYSTIIMILLILAIFSPLAESNAIGDADRNLFRYIHEDMQNKFLDIATENIQRMGEASVYTGVCMTLCAFGNEKMAETGKLAAAAFIENGFVTYALKTIVGRPRPLNKSEKNSFPSGHTTQAFALATVIGYKYTKLRIPLYIAAFGTAFSRVYQGRHYPSDVLAGAVIGTLAGWSVIHFKEPVLKVSF